MLLSLLDKMDEKLEAPFDWAYRRLWLEVAKASALRSSSVRPRLEALEDRLVLDAYTFTQAVSTVWFDTRNWLDNGQQAQVLPGANDDTTILAGKTVVLSGQSATVQSLTVNGTLTAGDVLTVAANGNPGSGSTTVAAGGVLNIGSTDDAGADAKLDTSTFTDLGTTTVGGPSSGSTGTLDAVFATLGNSSGGGGILDLGAAGSGLSGDATITNTLTVNSAASLAVGGSGNSGGTPTCKS